MDRARRVGAARTGGRAVPGHGGDGGRLNARHAALAAAWILTAGLGCTGLTSGDDEPVALEFVNPPDSIGISDTVVIRVRALNRGGDSIAGLTFLLRSLEPDTLGVDSARMAVIGLRAGSGRIVALHRDLPTEPFRIRVR